MSAAAARPKARGGVNAVHPRFAAGPWDVHETETRIAIKAGKRVVAYVQISPVQDYNAALIVQSPALFALAQRYASECPECAGVGIKPDNSPCDECRDIREVIALAAFSDEGDTP